ncbi:hypothetical protein A5821_000877 [Enterococcus sp. 7F3_DIV0205]|uniref:Uncharacterized protein n=1 Tax=Candidatus Enterococcus palustris TaxID=1834189 RepID=A0AAQ3Y775_9ENTE|nr:hypothetical protein A5821_001221 [Enterococcus sp. 7F3_DIV0205]
MLYPLISILIGIIFLFIYKKKGEQLYKYISISFFIGAVILSIYFYWIFSIIFH